jgi:transposase
MVYVGIDVAKDKHDCCILGRDGEPIGNTFTFPNSADGFEQLYKTIVRVVPRDRFGEVKIGLEATGHYSINLVSFIRDNGLEPVILNPLAVNLFRKAQTLRKTKTDKTDARFIASMLMSQHSSQHRPVSYHISELKILTRNRSRLVSQRAKLKTSLSRLITVVFPELPALVWSCNQKSMHAMLEELPNTSAIANCHLAKLTAILEKNSRKQLGKTRASEIRLAARNSIGSNSSAMAFEIQQVIRLIRAVQSEINILDKRIRLMLKQINTPLLTIPGVSFTLAGIILAELGDILNFGSPAKLLAFAGMEPSTYQSGKFNASSTPMVKRGSPYLRWAIMQAARLVAMKDTTFRLYMLKKKAEGKHHFVAIAHVGKKLVRVIFHMLKTNSAFVPQT